ncbi:hypothetical protein HTZ77_18680 [Nonomuraea sp. SMC257]|uniref:Uncharacterized protein n=1 Tax=Nonomuraea montanisoli TaxID=2741721 RepID=A0A7Y6M4F3_9ACTN|nr:hypothetical protein [Nonomuraea montanisoli]NUW33440.1 hypothetical protein [Nonomuraea montanisoli]
MNSPPPQEPHQQPEAARSSPKQHDAAEQQKHQKRVLKRVLKRALKRALMQAPTIHPLLAPLSALLGRWTAQIHLPGLDPAWTEFARTEDGLFLRQHSDTGEIPEITPGPADQSVTAWTRRPSGTGLNRRSGPMNGRNKEGCPLDR